MKEEVKARLELFHRVAPDSIGDQLRLEVLDCEGDTYLLRGKTQAWMRNAHGVLHGGMGATMADQAMGAVAYCYKAGEGIAPTIEMHVNYHRPLIPGEDVLIRVKVISATRTLIHTVSELYRDSVPEKVCITASATYFYKPTT